MIMMKFIFKKIMKKIRKILKIMKLLIEPYLKNNYNKNNKFCKLAINKVLHRYKVPIK